MPEQLGVNAELMTVLAVPIAVNAALTKLDVSRNRISDVGATSMAKALEVNADLKLKNLYVPSSIGSNPQLVAACREKGVKLYG